MKIQESDQFKVGGPRATYVLIICSLLYAIAYADWQVMAVVLQPMKVALGLTDAQIGGLNSAYFLGIILCSLPVAHLVDVWSRKKMIGLMAFIFSIFTVATAFVGGFVSLLLVRFGVGVGETGVPPAGTALISASYPEEKRGAKLVIFNAFITVGIIFGVIMGGFLSANYGGWRTPFYCFGIPGIILGILAFFMQDYKLQTADGSAVVHESFLTNLKQLLKIPTLRWLYFAVGMYCALQISVGTWFPAVLMRTYNVKEDVAGLVMGVVTILGLLGPIGGGILADRWMKKRGGGGRMLLASVSVASAVVFLFLVLLAVFDITNKNLMIFCAIMMPLHSICSGMAFPAAGATSQDVVPARLKGLAWGVGIVACFVLGGAWGPLVVGGISDAYGGGYQGLALGFAVAGLFGLLASFLFFKTSRHVANDMKKVKDAA
jgi:MFS family permease